ncbi:MAG TPA: RluA family pseudouridine synthase [Burkholderiaceae bacterium]|nr:RluA family pseudouridine synthase [Burkholderiaceae bacterium]
MKQSESIISTERISSDDDAVFAHDIGFSDIGFEDSQEDRHDEAEEENQEKRTFICDANVHGKRLDAVLVHLVEEFSRSYLQQLIERGAATLNSQVVQKAATKIKAGDTVTIVLHATPQSQAFKPESLDIDVVYEDAHLMVINKPAGLVVHPAPGNWSGTLLNGLLHRDKGAILLPRAGIVHRLDKDTSGLMVVARSRQAMDALVKKIADRQVNRQYVALAHQSWVGAKTVDVDQAIGRDPRNRLRMSVVDLHKTSGKLAKTTITLLQNADQSCLVQCRLHTGRTHQIRVHMAYLGHPLVADVVYGGTSLAGLKRQALHASKLSFEHPITSELMQFESKLPMDMSQALDALGLVYSATENRAVP